VLADNAFDVSVGFKQCYSHRLLCSDESFVTKRTEI